MLISKAKHQHPDTIYIVLEKQHISLMMYGYAYQRGSVNELGFNKDIGLFWGHLRPNKQLVSAMIRLRYMHESE